MKEEIETVRQKLQPALTRASQELAQAEKDMEVAGKRNSPMLILAALIIAFLIGWISYSRNPSQHAPVTQTPREDSGRPPARPRASPEQLAEQNKQERSQEALTFYLQGASSHGRRSSRKPSRFFRRLLELIRSSMACKHEGYALYRLGRYEESIKLFTRRQPSAAI